MPGYTNSKSDIFKIDEYQKKESNDQNLWLPTKIEEIDNWICDSIELNNFVELFN